MAAEVIDLAVGFGLTTYILTGGTISAGTGDEWWSAPVLRALPAAWLFAIALTVRGAVSICLRIVVWRTSSAAAVRTAWLCAATLVVVVGTAVELVHAAHTEQPHRPQPSASTGRALTALWTLAGAAAASAAVQLVLILRMPRMPPEEPAVLEPLLAPSASGAVAGANVTAPGPASAPAAAPAATPTTPLGEKTMRILALAKPEWPTLLFGTVALLLDSVADLLVPKFFGGLVDTVALRDGGALRAQTFKLVGLLSAGAAMAFARQLTYGIAGERVVARLRAQLFSRMLAQEAAYFDGLKSGELISRLSSDCTKLQDAAVQDVSALVASAATVTVAIALMFTTQWRLTLVTLAVIPPMVIAAAVYGKAIGKLSRAYQDKLSLASGISQETLSSVKTVRAFAGEPLQLASYLAAVGDPEGEGLLRVPLRALRVGLAAMSAYGLGVVRSLWLALFVAAITLAFFLAIVAILWYGCMLVLRGTSSLGELVAFVLYASEIGGSMGAIAQHFSAFTEAIGASSRVFELIDRVPALPSILDPIVMPAAAAAERCSASAAGIAGAACTLGGAGAAGAAAVFGAGTEDGVAGAAVPRVQFDDVSFAYASALSHPVLEHLNLSVPRGATVALVGPSGAGKSTFSSLLLRMYAPTGGRILLDGADLAHVDLQQLRSSVAVVAQEPVLFACSIADNIAYGARSQAAARAAVSAASAERGGGDVPVARTTAAATAAADAAAAELRARVEAVAARAHCVEFVSGFAEGYETLVGERGVRLSGGQKQRVAIARALLMDPPVLILDEATSALDAESEALVVSALQALTSGRTTIVIAHRLSTIVTADKIVCMVKGRVAGAGKHAQLLENCAEYAALVKAQLTGQHADAHAASGIMPDTNTQQMSGAPQSDTPGRTPVADAAPDDVDEH